jgi:hypothetical protein
MTDRLEKQPVMVSTPVVVRTTQVKLFLTQGFRPTETYITTVLDAQTGKVVTPVAEPKVLHGQ